MLLIEGVFPSSWKSTVVILLPKKKGIEPEFKNFRPISKLSFISKLIENAALNQILSHLKNLAYMLNIIQPIGYITVQSHC